MVAAALVGGAVVGGVVGAATAPDSPDTRGINSAATSNSAIAARQQDFAERQYTDQKALTDEFAPLYRQQVQTQLAASQTSADQSASQWGQYTKFFQPVEQQLATQSLEWANPQRYEQEAARAGSDATSQFDRARVETNRALVSAGASPEKIAALEAAGRLEEAKGVAGASSTARRTTEQQGMAYLDNAARFGRNMPSTGIATASLSTQQSNAALSDVNGLESLTATPATTASSLLTSAANINQSSGNLFAAAGQLGLQGDIAYSNAVMGGIAGGAKLGGMYGSSEKIKDMGGLVDVDAASDAVESSPSKGWRYKAGQGDGNTKDRLGPTAESLAEVAPEVSDGKQVDAIAHLGLHHAAIGGHAKKLKKMDKRLERLEMALSLADAPAVQHSKKGD